MRARKWSGFAEISAIQGAAYAEKRRRPLFGIRLSGLRHGAISALAVYLGCLGGPETQICAREVSADGRYLCCNAEQQKEISV